MLILMSSGADVCLLLWAWKMMALDRLPPLPPSVRHESRFIPSSVESLNAFLSLGLSNDLQVRVGTALHTTRRLWRSGLGSTPALALFVC
jgi:hypothetical protein